MSSVVCVGSANRGGSHHVGGISWAAERSVRSKDAVSAALGTAVEQCARICV